MSDAKRLALGLAPPRDLPRYGLPDIDHPKYVTPARGDARRLGVMNLALDVGTCWGGAERITFEFVKRLDPERFRRHLCVVNAPPPHVRAANEQDLVELEDSGVDVLRLERRSLASNFAWLQLYKRLAGSSIDVLHAHMPRASVPGTVVGRLARVPVIVNHEHGWSFQGQPVRRFLDRNVVARGSDALLAVSEWDRRRMVEVERIPIERIRILGNGIASVEDDGDGRDARSELAPSPQTRLIGAIGRLYPEKGHDDLIRAVTLLKRSSTVPIRCVIAGFGPERARLQALIDELDVAQQVQLLGRRQDVPEIIRALDVAVLSSTNEGSPLAVMEYMAGAAPIVATAVGGVPELIEDGVQGLLVSPGQPHELAAAIGRMLDDRRLAARLGQAARERQRAEFDLDVAVRRLEALYFELYAASRRTPRPR